MKKKDALSRMSVAELINLVLKLEETILELKAKIVKLENKNGLLEDEVATVKKSPSSLR